MNAHKRSETTCQVSNRSQFGPGGPVGLPAGPVGVYRSSNRNGFLETHPFQLKLPIFMGSIHVGPAEMHRSLDMSDAEIDTTCCQSREITTFFPKCCLALALSSRLVLEVHAFLSESPAKAMRLSLVLSKPRHEDVPIQHAGT